MRIAVSLLVVFLLALGAALAAGGCGNAPSVTVPGRMLFHPMPRAVGLAPAATLVARFSASPALSRHATAPVLLACHCRSVSKGEAGASAVAAQVASDMEPGNDDPNDLMTLTVAEPHWLSLPRQFAAALQPARRDGWPSLLLRPPRTALA